MGCWPVHDTYASLTTDGRAVADALYSPEELAGLPEPAVDLALGVGHPVHHAALRPGEVVLDVGCGAGIDTLLAARLIGPRGRAIGLDMRPAMVERTREHAAMAGIDWIDVREGLMEAIPLAHGAVDAVVTNGALNLCPRMFSGQRPRWPAHWPAHWRSQCSRGRSRTWGST